ncbi:TPA: DNA topoisomerase [Pseudomonas aeruginosa]|uniref:DNA topoisomerase n=1 Tax=Pseudomonas aeruginosa TaxID=287 RepID=UPI0005F0DEAB|nr:DNA topoisomerase [Pseudomonas aeruginosa]KJS29197.1 MAG: DNA topoisomerase [Pseudomonas sp. BRH_c35]MBH8731537.1 DNA topoisomerase [Pseudomonas aeruginosa]MCS8383174.1 DNA topoisomerase [Pseudomonas aeruginosa]MCS8456782.1 DNA topoisomerase [Pseudomonas aeruginosa]MCS9277129.1 DNA topoisomerase [Pseudomonas aeruginosa]
MKVYVAEKPKLGKAMVQVLSKTSPVTNRGGTFAEGNGWAVCWAAGHIFALEEPDHYIGAAFPGAPKGKNGKFKWSWDHLPLFPGQSDFPGWSIALDSDKKDLFKTIKSFVAKATVVVNAGDPDREGQLLIDEILEFLGNRKPVRRVLISGFDETTVANGLKGECDNADFIGLRDAARSRSRADWLAGMNLSRAISLHAKECGFQGSHIAYGRVMTALLGLIVQRDLAIDNFVPVDYFSLSARFKVTKGDFRARWKPYPNQAGLDEKGRLLDRRVADQLNAAVKGKTGKVVEYSDTEKTEAPPLPFSVDQLQILASKKFGYKSDAVLKALQSLYETHELTTYPRSDCQYLPESQHADAPEVYAAVTNNLQFGAPLQDIDLSRKSRAWNTSKTPVHHAIIPTTRRANISALSKIEQDLYEEICRRYLAQFMPLHRYRQVEVMVEVSGQRFGTSGTTPLLPGWKALYPGMKTKKKGEDDSGENDVLPPMAVGDAALCEGLDITAKKTTPPDHFTDATLLDAMINVHKYVTDERIKAIFKQMIADRKAGEEEAAGGLGTPATRHTFVPKLVDLAQVEFVKPKGKQKEEFIISTQAGKALIQALPAEIAKPDMTALWETAMREIEAGRSTIERFEAMQCSWITKVIAEIRSKPLNIPYTGPAKAGAGKGGSGPRVPPEPVGRACPQCGGQLMKRMGGNRPFIGCEGFRSGCKYTEQVAA